MMLAARSLELSLFELFKADTELSTLMGGDRYFDEPRRNQSFPYLTLMTSFSLDWSTATEVGEEHRLMINVWAGSQDRQLQQTILSRLRSLLTDPALGLTDHHLVNLIIERTEIRTDRKSRLLQGVMQLRAVTEQVVA